MAKRLIKGFPQHENYVEPFVGGGAVFFAKPLAPGKNVIGDFDRWVTDFYADVRRGALRKCDEGFVKSRSLFKRSQKNKSACHKVALSSLSFHGGRKTYIAENTTAKAGTVMYQNRLLRHKDYQKKLRKSYVINRGFEKTMKKFDSTKTLHFLDPPWPVEYSEHFYKGGRIHKLSEAYKKYKGTAFDPFHVAKVSKSMKGHVVVIINDAPIVRKAFCKDKAAFKCKKIGVATNTGHGFANRPNLLITKKARRR